MLLLIHTIFKLDGYAVICHIDQLFYLLLTSGMQILCVHSFSVSLEKETISLHLYIVQNLNLLNAGLVHTI